MREFAGKFFKTMFKSTSKPISMINSVDIVRSENYLVVYTFIHIYILEIRLFLVLKFDFIL